MFKITTPLILKQLKYDLVGKDSYRGVTLSYAWLANQFGHISLGFIPTCFCYNFIFKNVLFCASIISLFWFVFEIGNLLGPLFFNKISSSKYIYFPTKENYVFNPDWKNLANDTLTDIGFFVLGSFLYALFFVQTKLIIIVLLFLTVILLLSSSYWYKTKMYQYYAGYPFQYRLSQWSLEISEVDKSNALSFFNYSLNDTGHHLLISGSFKSGKTSLGVALLNELSIKNKVCSYVSAVKILDLLYEDKQEFFSGLWNWKNCDALMIDDFNPSKPINQNIITSELFESFINDCDNSDFNKNLLANKNVIWIIGNYNSLNTLDINDWLKMLENIGVDKSKISTIDLS